jgi:putative endonuclease
MKDICSYILFSKSLGKFYIGACQDSLGERIRKHNNHDYGMHRFTAAANDWELFLKIDVNNYTHAVRLERKIKSMKSSIFIRNLIIYPELIEKIKSETVVST